MQALSQRVEFQPTLDPREPVAERHCDIVQLVGVAAVQAGLQAAKSGADFLRAQIPLPEPELALRLTAREDHVREAFDLSTQCLVGGFPDAGRAVVCASRYDDENVGLCPSAFGEDLAEFLEIDLVLVRALGERSAIVDDRRIGFLAEAYELRTRTVEAILLHGEVQARQETLQLSNMVRIFRTDKRVQVYEATLRRCHVQSKFDVWKEGWRANRTLRFLSN